MKQPTLGNINNFKCVEDVEEIEWRTNGRVLGAPVEFRSVARKTYEVTLEDGKPKPTSPVNPGGLTVGTKTGTWRCESRGVTDPYGIPLRRVYHETWISRGKWEAW
jgi:hypothetical protein